MRDVSGFLERSRFQPGFDRVLDSYVAAWKFKQGGKPGVEVYLDDVYSGSKGLESLDSVYPSKRREEAEKEAVVELASDAFLTAVKAGFSEGVDPVFDQEYRHRRESVVSGLEIAENNY